MAKIKELSKCYNRLPRITEGDNKEIVVQLNRLIERLNNCLASILQYLEKVQDCCEIAQAPDKKVEELPKEEPPEPDCYQAEAFGFVEFDGSQWVEASAPSVADPDDSTVYYFLVFSRGQCIPELQVSGSYSAYSFFSATLAEFGSAIPAPSFADSVVTFEFSFADWGPEDDSAGFRVDMPAQGVDGRCAVVTLFSIPRAV